jgi:hypothetical protein
MLGLTDEVCQALRSEQPIEARVLGGLHRVELARGRLGHSEMFGGFASGHPSLS